MLLMLILLLFLSPRYILFIEWIFNNPRWNFVFPGSFLVPLLGFFFLPWTTLAYFFVFNPAHSNNVSLVTPGRAQ